jgi:hypothetical protein
MKRAYRSILSTDERIPARPLNPDEVKRFPERDVDVEEMTDADVAWSDSDMVAFSKVKFQAAYAGLTNGLPVAPPTLPVTDSLQLSCGVYICTARTARGKSVATAAFTGWLNGLNVPASYLYMFEPRARPLKVGQKKFFEEPQYFFRDFVEYIETFRHGPALKSPAVMILDSLTTPITSVTTANKDSSNRTFPGGMQPTDRAFLIRLSTIATEYNLVFIAVLNEQLLPYVNDLGGATEGHLHILDVRHFEIMDRGVKSKRQFSKHSIPLVYVNAALEKFGFGRYKDATNASRGTLLGVAPSTLKARSKR